MNRRRLVRIRLYLFALRQAFSPSTRAWAKDARERLADPNFRDSLKDQPSPEELAEQWRRNRGGA